MTYDGKHLGDTDVIVTEDGLYKETIIDEDGYGGYIANRELILSKRAFIECYRKWIEGVEK